MSNHEEQYKAAQQVTPGGSQTFSRQRSAVGTSRYPALAHRASGVYLWDVDNTKYLDLGGANAAVVLGYSHPRVVEAVREQLDAGGGTLTLPSWLEGHASELFVDATNTDMVRWVRTGSEAVSGAIRTAQQATGRTRVLVFRDSYHGWHPWVKNESTCVTFPRSAGEEDTPIAEAIPFNIPGPYALEEFAAVLVEPPRFTEIRRPWINWLKMLQGECSEAGTVLVYDDVVYGCRWATGGLAEHSGVQPDIACFSKALGNGVPVGCFAGKRELMKDTPVSSTFGGETMGLAAAAAVLEVHLDTAVATDLWEGGDALRRKLDDSLRGTLFEVVGVPVHWRFQVRPSVLAKLELLEGREDVALRRNLLDQFLNKCLDRKVLVHRSACNFSWPMCDEKIQDEIADVVGNSAAEVGRGEHAES